MFASEAGLVEIRKFFNFIPILNVCEDQNSSGTMSNEEQDQRLRQSQRAYVGFLDDGEQDGHYDSLVKELIANQEKRLVVNINDLRKALPERAKSLIENAGDEIVAFQV